MVPAALPAVEGAGKQDRSGAAVWKLDSGIWQAGVSGRVEWGEMRVIRKLATTTLMAMTKKDLISYIRDLEHNVQELEEQNEQQYQNVKDWQPVKKGYWMKTYGNFQNGDICEYTWKAECSGCHKFNKQYMPPFCPHCGAIMSMEED